MADHSHSSSQPALTGMDAHRATYEGFLNWSIAGALHCFFVLVALVDFRFVDFPLNLVLGFGGIIVGSLATIVAMKAGNKWLLPVVLLVIYGLLVGTLVHP